MVRARARALAHAPLAARAGLALAAIGALALVAPAARADDHDFWADIVDPHGDEVRMILAKAIAAQKQAQSYASYDGDPTGQLRARLDDDAYGMLRYAHHLAPHNTDVLLLLGQVADDSGRALPAIEALDAYLAEVDHPDANAHARLGRIHLRLGHYERAAYELREAIAGSPPAGGATIVDLAQALVAQGRADDATQLLADAVDNLSGQYYGLDASTLAFALAVAYDQNEQLTEAFRTLDHLQSSLSSGYAAQLQQSIAQLDFVPAIERHYWQGLLYETAGFYGEARAEWLDYAAAGAGARYRDRALAHVRALDELRAAELDARHRQPHARPRPPAPRPVLRKRVPHRRTP